MTKFLYSIDEETYYEGGDTIEGAIETAIDEQPDAFLCDGQREVLIAERDDRTEKAGFYFSIYDAERTIENMQERAYERVGEHAEDWLTKITDDQENDLRERIVAAIDSWADTHGLQPCFYGTKNERKYPVSVETIELVSGEKVED